MRSRIAHPARRAPVLVFAAALMLCAGREASAQPAPATPREGPAPAIPKVVFPVPHVHVWTRLKYERKPGAEACLDEAVFRNMAADEEDPFAPDPQGVDAGELHVVVRKSPEGFVAEYVWTGSSDVRVPERRIAVSGHTWRRCFDAVSASRWRSPSSTGCSRARTRRSTRRACGTGCSRRALRRGRSPS